MKTALAMLFAALLASHVAHAEEDQRDRVSFDVQSVAEVGNDLLVAVLYVREEGRDPRAVAESVNRAVAWGVQRAKAAASVEVETLGYRTQPLYERNGQLSGRWRISQSIRLQSADSAALSALLGELQERLALQSLDYQLSPERRGVAEDELIDAALARFRQRAERVVESMGAAGYRVLQLNINTPQSGPRPVMMRAAAMADAAPGPSIEAGDQQVQVQVRGSIQLLHD